MRAMRQRRHGNQSGVPGRLAQQPHVRRLARRCTDCYHNERFMYVSVSTDADETVTDLYGANSGRMSRHDYNPPSNAVGPGGDRVGFG